MTDRRRWFWCWFLVTLVTDQAVKTLVRHALFEHQVLPRPWPGVVEITLSFNRGVAFGALQGFGLWLAPVAVVMTGMAIRHAHKNPGETRWVMSGLGLLCSGALGNLFDRVAFGKVTDMIWVRIVDFPVFNVADSCITAAAIMLGVVWIKPEPEAANAAHPTEEPASEASAQVAETPAVERS